MSAIEEQARAAIDECKSALAALDAATSAVQHAILVMAGMGGNGAPNMKRIDVPWIGQNTNRPDDDWSNSDCGPTCVAMWLRSRGEAANVDDVSRATGLAKGYLYTLPAHLITAAGHYGLRLQRVVHFKISDIKSQIDGGMPVLALVHYASLEKRFSERFKAGHWILVIGYTDNGMMLYHDPYWPDESGGREIVISEAALARAMQDCAKDGNTPEQGLVQVSAANVA